MKQNELKIIIKEEIQKLLQENSYLNKAELSLMNAKVSYIKALMKIQKSHPDKNTELKQLKTEFEAAYNNISDVLNKIDSVIGITGSNSSTSPFKFS